MPAATTSTTTRRGTTAGRKIEQHHPLEKGKACATCKARKVRCDGEKACGACRRTARFEGRDPDAVVCLYTGKQPTGATKPVSKSEKGKGKASRIAKKGGAARSEGDRGSLDADYFVRRELESLLSSNLAHLSPTAPRNSSTSTSSSSSSYLASYTLPSPVDFSFQSSSAYQYDQGLSSAFSSDSSNAGSGSESTYSYPSSDEADPPSPPIDEPLQFTLPPIISGTNYSSSMYAPAVSGPLSSTLQLYPDFSNLFLPPQPSLASTPFYPFLGTPTATPKEAAAPLIPTQVSSWFSPSLFSTNNLSSGTAPYGLPLSSAPSLFLPTENSMSFAPIGSSFPPQFKNGEHVLDTLVLAPQDDLLSWSHGVTGEELFGAWGEDMKGW